LLLRLRLAEKILSLAFRGLSLLLVEGGDLAESAILFLEGFESQRFFMQLLLQTLSRKPGLKALTST
jgi:hypothetical protein